MGENLQRSQRQCKEPTARIQRLSYFSLSLQPPENKNITGGGTKIKRKDNIQFLKEKAQMQFTHERLVQNYAAWKASHILRIHLRKVVSNFFLFP